MDLKLAAWSLVALANPEVARAVANLVKETVKSITSDMKLDFGHDAPEGGVRGMSEGAVSFPVRPGQFDEKNLNGTILVKMVLDPPVAGSGEDIAGTATTAKLFAGYYFKTPRLPGKGKYMFETPAGEAGITFDERGDPELDDAGEIGDLVDAIEALAEKVVEDPPEGAKSLTRDPEERKRIREQNEEALQRRQEQEREEKHRKEYEAQREADQAVYGSAELFAQYLEDQEEADFGPADLQKLLNTMYNRADLRALNQVKVKDAVEALGYKFNPGKRHLSAVLCRAAAKVASAAA